MPFTFDGVNAEEVLRRTLSEAIRSGRVIRLITAHEPEAAAASGLIAKVLRAEDIEFELMTDLREVIIDDAQVICVGLPPNQCKGCITINQSQTASFTRVGFNYVFKYRSLSKGVLDLISEFELVTKDYKLTLAAAMLTKYTPRLYSGGVRGGDAELIKQLSSEDIIEIKQSLPIIGWEVTNPEKAVAESIDVLIPSRFLRPTKKVTVEELANEVGLSPQEFKDNAYIVKKGYWISRDLHQASYIIDWLTDTKGAEAVTASMINQAYLRWGAIGMMSSLKELRHIIDNIRSYEVIKVGNARYLVLDDVDPHRFSATLASKSLRSAGVLDVANVLIKFEGSYYIPASGLNHELRVRILEKGGLCEGGYLVVKELQSLT